MPCQQRHYHTIVLLDKNAPLHEDAGQAEWVPGSERPLRVLEWRVDGTFVTPSASTELEGQ
jgi:hypothetical protein